MMRFENYLEMELEPSTLDYPNKTIMLSLGILI